MRKDRDNKAAEITVLGTRAREYTIHRPLAAELPARELDYGPELVAGMHAWLEPVGREYARSPKPVDTKRALAGLLSCETDFLRWLEAREWMFEVESADTRPELWFMREREGFGSRARKEASRMIWLQHKNLRQRFDKRLEKWACEFGSLGIPTAHGPAHGHDGVDDMMRCTLAVREWATSDESREELEQFSFTFRSRFVPGEVINRAANQCTRASRAGRWEAPSLWSAICFDLRRSDQLGWKFDECDAVDCVNVFLRKRERKQSEPAYCSPRCGKWMRDQQKKQPG